MNLCVICVGKLQEKYWVDAANEYLKRLSRFGKAECLEIQDLKEPKGASDADRERIKQKEGEMILHQIRPRDYVTALCIEGVKCTSTGLAATLKARYASGQRQVFIIGGSLGLSDEVKNRAQQRLSMSDMTFPHQLARVMLLEQLYRAEKIHAGEAYHK